MVYELNSSVECGWEMNALDIRRNGMNVVGGKMKIPGDEKGCKVQFFWKE